MQWYITVAVVREFLGICGLDRNDDGAVFDRAAKALQEACRDATLKKDEGHRQIWLTKIEISGKMHRLELTVSTADRPEGEAPQLVRVRDKTRKRPGRNQR